MTWPTTRDSQIKRVDILAEKPDEILIVELEDLPSKRDGEQGVGYCELGGIILLSAIAAQDIPKQVTLRLVFRDSIVKQD